MTNGTQNIVTPVTPIDFELFMSVALLTPIVLPGTHPSDPGTLWGPPINAIGLSGIGKSQRIKRIGKRCGIDGVHTVFVATKQPSDFTGIFMFGPNGIINECALPQARKCIDNGGGLIFLDEFSCATPRTQAACLSFVNDRQIGDHVLPPKTRIVLAMNPPKYAAGGFSLESPMANRMGHVQYVQPNKEQWGSWLDGEDAEVLPIAKGEATVIKEWNDQWPRTLGLIKGFIDRVGESVFVDQPEPEHPNSGGAWPSYRVWHWALCAMTTCRALGLGRDLELQFVEAFCGGAAATQWATWVAEADLPHPEEMLNGKWAPDQTRPDKTIAALTAMTEWVSNRPDRDERLKKAVGAWKLLLQTKRTPGLGDLTANCAAKLLKKGLARKGHQHQELAETAEAVIFELTKGGYTALADQDV